MTGENVTSGRVADLLGSFVIEEEEKQGNRDSTSPNPNASLESGDDHNISEEVLTNFDQAIRRVTTQLSLYRTFEVKEEAELCETQLDRLLSASLRQIDFINNLLEDLKTSFTESYPTDLRVQELGSVVKSVAELRTALAELAKSGTKTGHVQKEAEVSDDLCKIGVSVHKLWRMYMTAKAEQHLLNEKLDEVQNQLNWGKGLTYYITLPFLLPIWLGSKILKQVFVSATDFVENFVRKHSPAHVDVPGMDTSIQNITPEMTSSPEKELNKNYGDSSVRSRFRGLLFTSTPKNANKQARFRSDTSSGSYLQGPDASAISRTSSFEKFRGKYNLTKALQKSHEIFHLALKYGSRPITYKRNIILGLLVYGLFVLAVFLYYVGFSFLDSNDKHRPLKSNPSTIGNILGAVLEKYISLRYTGPAPT